MKKYAKYLYDLLIYGSVVFFVIYLFRTEDFTFSGVKNYWFFVLSVLVCVGGFAVQTLNWLGFLRAYDVLVSWRTAFVSMGLTVFGKYIPGKVWLIIGRSGYIIRFQPKKAHILHISSTYVQMLWTFTGIAVGATFIPFAEVKPEIKWTVSVALAIFVILIFVPEFQRFCYRIVGKVMKKNIDVPILESKTLLRLLPQFFLTWILWAFSFYLLVLSMGGSYSDWPTALAFILATNMSYFVIFLPGGIGVREGLITTFLMMKGFDKSTALSISVMSRFWFTLVEFLFFAIAFLWKYIKLEEDKKLIAEAETLAVEIPSVEGTKNS